MQSAEGHASPRKNTPRMCKPGRRVSWLGSTRAEAWTWQSGGAAAVQACSSLKLVQASNAPSRCATAIKYALIRTSIVEQRRVFVRIFLRWSYKFQYKLRTWNFFDAAPRRFARALARCDPSC